MPIEPAVQREAMYIGDAEHARWACYHTARSVPARDAVVVICNPLGHEYVHSHRSVRHLADALARAGFATLRFDYHGTGDSPGSDLSPDRLTHWLQDIRHAIAAARTLSHAPRVCLLGIRLGATLAAMSTSVNVVDLLVLWNPSASGRRYVREMQALAQAGQTQAPSASGALCAAGFLMTPQTQEQLKAITLTTQPVRARQRALIVQRDDAPADEALREHVQQGGAGVDVVTCPGFADMMAEPLDALVPQQAIAETVQWLLQHSAAGSAPPAAAALPTRVSFVHTRSDSIDVGLVETCERFGDGLLGIHCAPDGGAADLPTVVLFSAGVVHRIGPNRLYVDLARDLAAHGFASLRCDIAGIGDSVPPADGGEHHPYPHTALRDAQAAMAFLSERYASRRFILLGLCAGAYTAFCTSLVHSEAPIAEVVLINPLTYHWVEGDSLDTRHFREVAHYKGSMRRLESWKKLLSGRVNLASLGGVLTSHLRKQAASYLQALTERWLPARATRLSRQLRQLDAQGRHVSLFIAEGDPGWDMMLAQARYTAQRARAQRSLSLHFIAKADHTFTDEAPRQELVRAVVRHLKQRLGVTARSSRSPELA